MNIELNRISKYYTNPETSIKQHVLTDISLHINAGDSIAIIGPSGSGKSTLLNIIGTLDLPSSGAVFINGMNTSQLTENQLADFRNKKIGFVFQAHYLLPQLNLMENILLPAIPNSDKTKRKLILDRAMYLLAKVGLTDKLRQLPGQLSGGEAQRGAVVRALINEPEIILADEPTGSLDTVATQQVGDLLSAINQEFKVAVVVVTHSMYLANKLNIVYKLEEEKLVRQ